MLSREIDDFISNRFLGDRSYNIINDNTMTICLQI